MNFENFNFHPLIAANIKAAGYTTPTPIQSEAILPVMEGNDLIGIAQTGTGKTAAFALPILHKLITSGANRGRRHAIRVLIVVPTRELAEQIFDSFGELGRQTNLRGATVYGGVGINPQIQKLRDGVDIVVACPGRLLDHIGQGTIYLSEIEVLVLDEADRMFDMGFLPDIRRILKLLPTQRQTLLFSATMPDDIRRLTGEALKNPITVQVDPSRPAESVTHGIYPIASHLKTDLLLALLKQTDTESVLVFTAAKHRAKRLAEKLEKAGYKATSLQGNLSQNRRQEALDGFKSGAYQIMAATDVVSRGIDVSSISHVINYDMPDTIDAYTHRIGRTGRAAKTGDAYTFVTDDDYEMVRLIERSLGEKVQRLYLPGFDYNAPPSGPDLSSPRPPRSPQRRLPSYMSAAPGLKSTRSAPSRPSQRSVPSVRRANPHDLRRSS